MDEMNRYFEKKVLKFEDGSHVFFISGPHLWHEVKEKIDQQVKSYNEKIRKLEEA